MDTNLLISAMMVQAGTPNAIVRAWRSQAFELATSAALLAELDSVVNRPRIRARLTWSEDEVTQLVTELRLNLISERGPPISVLADAADNRVLEAAVAGGADYVVTGDKAFLDLGSYEGIEIVTPARFAAILSVSF